MENSSRIFSEIFIFWVVTQAVLLENSSNFFFSKFQFWGVKQAVLLENSSIRMFWLKPYIIYGIWYVTFGLDECTSKTAYVTPQNSSIDDWMSFQ